MWGPNAERGIFRSRTAARPGRRSSSSTRRRARPTSRWIPSNPRILYAGFWQVVRVPVGARVGRPGREPLEVDRRRRHLEEADGRALPEGISGKVGVAVSAARPEPRLGVRRGQAQGGLFRSDNAGEKWTHVNDEHKIRERAWYYSLDLSGPEERRRRLPSRTSRCTSSIDGGKTFSDAPRAARRQPRPVDRPGRPEPLDRRQRRRRDDHLQRRDELVVAPEPADRAVLPRHDGQPLSVLGLRRAAGQHDGRIPSGVVGGAIGRSDWHAVGGGESGWMAVDPKDPERRLRGRATAARSPATTIARKQEPQHHGLAAARDRPGGPDLKYRFQWSAPIMISPHDPKALYHAVADPSAQPRRGADAGRRSRPT